MCVKGITNSYLAYSTARRGCAGTERSRGHLLVAAEGDCEDCESDLDKIDYILFDVHSLTARTKKTARTAMKKRMKEAMVVAAALG